MYSMHRSTSEKLSSTIRRFAKAATFLAALPLFMANPSSAFDDSGSDLQIKQFLAGLINQLQAECTSGYPVSCTVLTQVNEIGNGFVLAEQGCSVGNPIACQQLALRRSQVNALAQKVAAALGRDGGSGRGGASGNWVESHNGGTISSIDGCKNLTTEFGFFSSC